MNTATSTGPAASPRPNRRRRRQRGTILILVLGTILVLSALVSAFLEIAGKEIVMRGTYFGRDNMRLNAWQAFDATIAVLNTYLQLDNGLYGPVQWGGNNILQQRAWSNSSATSDSDTGEAIFAPADGMTVNVTITDLTGYMPLDRLSTAEMTAVLDTIGVTDPAQQQVDIDTLNDWTQPYTGNFSVDGAGPDYYEGLDPGYDPTYTNITSFDEFHYIKNWQDIFWDENGTELPAFQQFKRIITLHDSGGAVNVNTADPDVIAVLSDQFLNEVDPTVLPTYLAGTDQIQGTADDMLIRNSDEESTGGVLSANGTSSNTTGNTTGGNTTGATTSTNTSNQFAAMQTGAPRNTGTPGTGRPPNTGGTGTGAPRGTGTPSPGGGTGTPSPGTGTGTGAGTGGGTTGATAANSTGVGVGFLCRMLKINILVSLGDSKFLLSTIVEPATFGTGVPAGTGSGGGSTSSTTSTSSNSTASSGSGSVPALTNTSGNYPFQIIDWAENYDLP